MKLFFLILLSAVVMPAGAQATPSCDSPVTLYVQRVANHPLYRLGHRSMEKFPLDGLSDAVHHGCSVERRLDIVLGAGTSDVDVSIAYNALQKLQTRNGHVYYEKEGRRQEVKLPALEDAPPK